MLAQGNSESMVVARGRVKAIFDNDFPMFGKWDQLSEEQRCSDEVYSHFAEFLTYTYTTAAGSHLCSSTAPQYLSTLINMAKTLHGATGTDTSKLFLTCLTRTAAQWQLNGCID